MSAFAIPTPETKIYVCHDYQPDGRDLAFMATVGDHRKDNIHVGEAVSADEFVAMREARDATLAMPTLILPSLPGQYACRPSTPMDASGRFVLKSACQRFWRYGPSRIDC